MKDFSVIIPSFKNSKLLFNCISSFEKFKPESITITYLVIENSNTNNYRDELSSKFPTAKWICNKDAPSHGSDANASAITKGAQNCETELLFMCHTDVCVLSHKFYDSIFSKIDKGFSLVGFRIDNHVNRIKAVHISGIFTYKEIALKSNLYGDYKHLDCGDGLTVYCRENNLKYYCHRNTFNKYPIKDIKDSRIPNTNKPIFDLAVDDEGSLVYSHLGRGSSKPEKLELWYKICDLYLQ